VTLRCPECGSHEVSAFADVTVEMDMRQSSAEDFVNSLKWNAIDLQIPNGLTDTSLMPRSSIESTIYGKFRALLCRDCGHESEWTHSMEQRRAQAKQWVEKED